jgi:hypothetical protein
MLLAGRVTVPGRSDVTDEFERLGAVAHLLAVARVGEVGHSPKVSGWQLSIQIVRVHFQERDSRPSIGKGTTDASLPTVVGTARVAPVGATSSTFSPLYPLWAMSNTCPRPPPDTSSRLGPASAATRRIVCPVLGASPEEANARLV